MDTLDALGPWIVIWLASGMFAGSIGAGKGQSFGGWFVIGVLLGPLGVLVAMLASRSPEAEAARLEKIEAERQRLRDGTTDA